MREPPATGYWRLQGHAERLRGGRCSCHRGVNLWIAPDGHLEVRVHSDWRAELTVEEQRLDDRSFAHRVIEELTTTNPELGELLRDRPHRFIQVNDRGTGATCVYYLADGKRIWSITVF